MSASFARRNTAITVFVIAWSLVFFYETFRLNYLSPLAGRELPKLRFLFPPAGWIMFFNVGRSAGFAEVYGVKSGVSEPIDPHAIFETKALGYDNIHRNLLVGVLYEQRALSFCALLRRKFPQYETFTVVYAEYPDPVEAPQQVIRKPLYRCAP